ncbi:MAG TPA: BTAD domain-containing putative transcriptional regulator [Candidatus Baltobacteraceae bacterium]|nr:BTAD domain-containing putative transcriptional regulator [Candidatus Baltobacteraceae bacterium]
MLLTATNLDVRLFGIPRVSCEQPPAVTLSAKALAVLAYVILHREHRVTRESVAFALWPDEPEEQAMANLRRALYLCQHALPPGTQWLLADRKSIAWNDDAPYRLDVADYDRFIAAGRTAQALELYAGELLKPFDDEWVQELRAHYHNLQEHALTQTIAQLNDAGDTPGAIALARRALQFDPWNEEFVRAMMDLRSRAGDRAGALAEYRTFESRIKAELGAAPTAETLAVYERIRSGEASAPAHPARTNNLPAPISSFIGREAEVAALLELTREKRLITLVGAGGVGKTRLALQAAARVQDRYSDGVWFVDVTPLETRDALLQALAGILKLHTREGADLQERIVDGVGEKRMLLVLDNCERAVHACASFVRNALERCANLAVLVTSRRRMRIAGETLYEVSPLSSTDAARLFCERAAGAAAGFGLSDENAAAVHAICEQLEGIPLAIELATGRLRVLSVSQLQERLSDRFALLRTTERRPSPHQQTLRATIDWSYALLDDEQRIVLTRLAVFSNASSLEAIAAVCEGCAARDTLDILEELAEMSLLLVVRGLHENRYRLLDSVREYLLEKLRERNDLNDARARHLAYFVEFAERLEPALTRAGQEKAMSSLTHERDNLRAAFSWPTTERHELRMRLRLASALRWFYWFRGLFDLARQRLAENLQAYGFERSALYARAEATFGFFVLQQNDVAGACDALQRALRACPENGEERERAMIELQLGLACAFAGDDIAAARYLGDGLERARGSADSWLLSYAFALQGIVAGMSGKRGESIELLRKAVDLSEQTGESFQGTFWLLNLAVQQYYVDPSAAAILFLRCAARAIADENARAVAGSFEGLGWCLQSSGARDDAATLLGAAEELRAQTSQPLLPQWYAAHDGATDALGDGTQAAFAAGAQAVREKRFDDLYERARSALA